MTIAFERHEAEEDRVEFPSPTHPGLAGVPATPVPVYYGPGYWGGPRPVGRPLLSLRYAAVVRLRAVRPSAFGTWTSPSFRSVPKRRNQGLRDPPKSYSRWHPATSGAPSATSTAGLGVAYRLLSAQQVKGHPSRVGPINAICDTSGGSGRSVRPAQTGHPCPGQPRFAAVRWGLCRFAAGLPPHRPGKSKKEALK